eukprot:GHVT01066099.1.p1 GENE.GHVT01066099.1~~GHVT01066099.1.p1  ORF type:complete len:264 (+),score=31.58 GHVT01066099.1:179-970(+)
MSSDKASPVQKALLAAGLGKLDKIEPSDPAVQAQYEQFKLDVTKQAILSLRGRIPSKIIQFNAAVNVNCDPGQLLHAGDLDKTSYCIQATDGANGDMPKGKKIKLDNDRDCYTHHAQAHKQIYEQLEALKTEASELIETVGNIKLWIQLNVPRIEDGNNFGVGIQEEAIQELARVEDSAFNLYDAVVKYYMARAKLSTKVIKYPNVADYQEAIRELDEKEWIHIKITKVDFRNNYSMLYDLLVKNWEKVVKPKNEDTHTRMTF